MMTRVSTEDLLTAAEWLDVNEGDVNDGGGSEKESCHRVAEWLRSEAERRDIARATRTAAKTHGISISTARNAVRRALKKSSG